jgi:hypothetical protein
MHKRQIIASLVSLGLLLGVAGCSSSGTAFQNGLPDRAAVERAASLSFRTSATCRGPDQYGEYTCTERPASCGVQHDGYLDTSVTDAGCWQTVCDVALGITRTHGEPGTADFYYCQRVVIGCTSMTGGCPSDDICITGHKKHLAVDEERTQALPRHGGGDHFSCPYHDED